MSALPSSPVAVYKKYSNHLYSNYLHNNHLYNSHLYNDYLSRRWLNNQRQQQTADQPAD
ncbi:hypothetical protein GRB07_15365 [Yersinia pestis]|nr:hypothetical protein YPPY72_4539 [Yersinia pestis PY-72]NBG78073.1 hypothetical protein [Yersinia pestis]